MTYLEVRGRAHVSAGDVRAARADTSHSHEAADVAGHADAAVADVGNCTMLPARLRPLQLLAPHSPAAGDVRELHVVGRPCQRVLVVRPLQERHAQRGLISRHGSGEGLQMEGATRSVSRFPGAGGGAETDASLSRFVFIDLQRTGSSFWPDVAPRPAGINSFSSHSLYIPIPPQRCARRLTGARPGRR